MLTSEKGFHHVFNMAANVTENEAFNHAGCTVFYTCSGKAYAVLIKDTMNRCIVGLYTLPLRVSL
jgi:hypothetical protein